MFIFVIIIATIAGFSAGIVASKMIDAPKEIRMYNWYMSSSDTMVSPHQLMYMIDKGIPVTIVDLRSYEEYEKGHIATAINIPVFRNKEGSPRALDDILLEFQALDKSSEIVVYCYSESCMTSKQLGATLAGENIFVKQLNVGYYEWSEVPKSWLHPHERFNSSRFIATGDGPGEVIVKNPGVCPVDGGFGC